MRQVTNQFGKLVGASIWRWHGVLPAILLLAISHGCAPAGGKGNAVPGSLYYPVKPGMEWTYQGPGHRRTIRVVKHEMVDKKMCALIETRNDDELIAEEHVYVTGKGVFGLTSNGLQLPAPLPILRLPPFKGRTWRVNFIKDGQRTRGVYTIGRGEVKVPFGEFQAVTLRGEQYRDDIRIKGFTRWFAKDIGVVKEEITSPTESLAYELIDMIRP